MKSPSSSNSLSRRTFLKGLGTSAVTVASVQVGAVADELNKASGPGPQGPGVVPVTLTINGEPRDFQLEPRVTLLDALRYHSPLTGTKEVCDRGTCGACSVLIDGRLTYACMKLAIDAQGQKITTVEGLAQNGQLTPVQQAFVQCDALMCGFCTPGLVMAVSSLLEQNPHPTEEEVRHACSGNLCRCGTYPHVIRAALAASGADPGAAFSKIADPAAPAPPKPVNPTTTGAPESWPETLTVLGEPTQRLDAPAKVTGQAKYAYDVQPPGVLWGMILRSKWPAAQVTKIDLTAAQTMPGVKAAILEGGENRTVRFYGQELAAVAATTKQECLDAIRAIKVEAKPLPFVVHVEDAVKPDAPQVFTAPNLSSPSAKEGGDVDAAFATAAAVAEGELSTPVQLHHALETHGNTVSVENDQMTAWASTQGIFSVRDGLADHMHFPKSNVRVICDYMGGGFGAKFGPGAHGGLAARLSQAAGAPVKLMLTRLDEGLAVGNRPSSHQRIKLAADKDGKLVGADCENHGSPGIGGGGQTAGGGGGANIAIPYLYDFPTKRINQYGVALNSGPSSAFRAPGHPPASFGTESVMDDLAVKLGMDPVEFRLKNDSSEVRHREYAAGMEKFGWKEKYRAPGSSPGPVKTGVGVAAATWGGGGKGSKADVQINSDGTVEVRCGTQDLGTGSRTVVGIVAAEAFGLKPAQITVKIGDTNLPPSGGSGGSSTTASAAPAVWDACQNALAELQKQTGTADVRGAAWFDACRKLGVNPLTVHGEWQPGLSSSGAGGVQFAEVEVDTETGSVRVKKMVAVHDCGLVVNPLATASQINGGIMCGLGYALFEERVMDRQTGVLLNTSFDSYKIPNLTDAPDIEIVLLNMPQRGVIGIGEPAVIPAAGAIANAVANAIGVRVHHLPITPARVLAALGKVPNVTSA